MSRSTSSRRKKVIWWLVLPPSIAALALLILAGALWVRSYSARDSLTYTHFAQPPHVRDRRYVRTEAISASGVLLVIVRQAQESRQTSVNPDPGWSYDTGAPRPVEGVPRDPHTVFGWGGSWVFQKDFGRTFGSIKRQTLVAMPYRLIAPLLLLLSTPGIVLGSQSLRRATRLRKGQCVACGYDLRSSRERCPECGEAIDAAAYRRSEERRAALLRRWRWWEANRPSSPAVFIGASLTCSTAFLATASGAVWRLPWPSEAVELLWTAAPYVAAFLALAALLEARRRSQYLAWARLSLVVGVLVACARAAVAFMS